MVNLMQRRRMMMQAAGATPSGPLYPLENGTHTFTSSSNSYIAVTNGNHIKLDRKVSGNSNTYASAYPLSANTANITSSSNRDKVSDTWFHLNTGDAWEIKLKNFHSGNTGQKMTIGFRTTSSESIGFAINTGEFVRSNADKTFSGTIETGADVGSLTFWWASFASTVEFDIELWINGVQYI